MNFFIGSSRGLPEIDRPNRCSAWQPQCFVIRILSA